MRVYVVDRSLPGVGIVGRMEAVVEMISIYDNRITKVLGDACLMESRTTGSLSRMTDVSISVEEAKKYGYGNGGQKQPTSDEKGGSKAKRRLATKNSPEREYSRTKPVSNSGKTASKPSRKGGRR